MEKGEYYSRKMDRFSNDKDHVHQSKMKVLVQREEMNLFSMLKPTINQDGDAWICLYDDDLATGVVGCGDTPYEAIIDWNKAWHKKATVVKRSDKQDICCQHNNETHEVEKIKWEPRLKEKYWTFNAAGIFVDINDNATHDIDRINNGLIFKTQQEAQEFFDKIKQLVNENS